MREKLGLFCLAIAIDIIFLFRRSLSSHHQHPIIPHHTHLVENSESRHQKSRCLFLLRLSRLAFALL